MAPAGAGTGRPPHLPALLLSAALLLPAAAWGQAAQPGPVRPPAVQQAPIRMELSPLEGGPVHYRGLRTRRHEAGRVVVTTEFSSADGELLQRTEGVYEEDTLAPVSWRLHDLRSGETETIERKGDAVHLSHRETGDAAVDRDSVAMAADLIFTPTVEALIQRRWQALAAGETVRFRLLVPSRQDVFQFRLVRDAERSAAQEGRLVVRMEPDTWLIRQLVDPLFFALDEAPPHRLRTFRGRTSIRTEDGDPQDMRIVYRYAGEG